MEEKKDKLEKTSPSDEYLLAIKELEIARISARNKDKLAWYYRPSMIVLAIFLFGPLGLLPLWFRPRTRMWIKLTVSSLVLVMTILLTIEASRYYKEMMEHYKELAEVISDI